MGTADGQREGDGAHAILTPTPETADIAVLVERLCSAGTYHGTWIDLMAEAANALQSLSAELAEARRNSDIAIRAAIDSGEALENAQEELATMREALEPFARLPEIPPRFSNADYVQMEIHYTISPEEMDNLQRLTRGAMRSDRASLLISLDGVNAGDFRRARRAIGGSNAE